MVEKNKLQTLDTLVDKIIFTQEKERFIRAHNSPLVDDISYNTEIKNLQDELASNATKEELKALFKRYIIQFMKNPYPNAAPIQKMQALNLDVQSILEVLYQSCPNQPVNQILLKMCAYGQVGSFLFSKQKNEQIFNQLSTFDLIQDLPHILIDFSNKKASSTLRYRVGCDMYHRCIPFLWPNVTSLSFCQSANTIKQFLGLKDPAGTTLSSLLNSSEIISLLKGRSLSEKKEILSSRHVPNESITLGNMLKNLLNQPIQTLIGSEGIALVKDCFSQREKVQTHLKSAIQNPIQTVACTRQFLKQIWQRSQKQ